MVFIRRELGTRLRLKRIPDLHVRLDDSIERGTRILHLLDSIETGRDAGDATPGETAADAQRGAAPAGSADPLGLPPEAPPGPPPPEGFARRRGGYAASLAARSPRDATRAGHASPAGPPGAARAPADDPRSDGRRP